MSCAEARLPRRDWLLMPLLGLLTICLLSAGSEMAARRIYGPVKTNLPLCKGDEGTLNGITNAVCWETSNESPLVEHRINSCGDRAGEECTPKPAGAYRIVMIGTSFPMGLRMQWEHTFAALLPRMLTRAAGRPVDVYNEGGIGLPHMAAAQFGKITAAKPDLILWVVTPWDIEHETPLQFTQIPAEKTGSLERAWFRMREVFAERSLQGALVYIRGRALFPVISSHSAGYLQHLLAMSESQYVKSCMVNSDELGYLQAEPSEDWRKRLRFFEDDASLLLGKANAAGVPVVFVMVPVRQLAAVLSHGEWPAGYNPYRLNNELRSIITRNGGSYIDILDSYRSIPNAAQYYLPVDGHLTAEGHEMLAKMLTGALTGGVLPPLKAIPPIKTATGQE